MDRLRKAVQGQRRRRPRARRRRAGAVLTTGLASLGWQFGQVVHAPPASACHAIANSGDRQGFGFSGDNNYLFPIPFTYSGTVRVECSGGDGNYTFTRDELAGWVYNTGLLSQFNFRVQTWSSHYNYGGSQYLGDVYGDHNFACIVPGNTYYMCKASDYKQTGLVAPIVIGNVWAYSTAAGVVAYGQGSTSWYVGVWPWPPPPPPTTTK